MKRYMRIFLICTITASLVTMPSGLAAKEKAGANVVVTRKDGTQVAGELICVKREFITVMDAGSGVNVDFKEIREIEVKKKSKKGKAGIGLLIGLISGFAIGFVATDGMRRGSGPKSGFFPLDLRGSGGIICAPLGGFVGLMAGIGAAADKKYKLEGKYLIPITVILAKLDKQARFTAASPHARLALLGKE